ncbi:C-type lectin lectoxin-Phi1-like [Penaeus japonicus]|uniref:C-type lectin lectoxin-Phi1-like n=1 Tax=Penaeus japonicus TaxID=27405 RepID=UPI001C7102B7|nr:C-type lectin lectoxin-Phi1-like [Penaeus japonicus]
MFIFLVSLLASRVSAKPSASLVDIRSAVAVSQLILAQQAHFFNGLINATDSDCHLREAHHQTATEKECPFPYVNVMGECFYLSKYKLNWDDARKYCLGMSGDLAVPALLYALKTYVIEEKAARSTWIGGQNEGNGTGWHWVNGQPIAAKDWAVGSPATGIKSQECLELRRDRHPPLKSRLCNLAHKFICQYV